MGPPPLATASQGAELNGRGGGDTSPEFAVNPLSEHMHALLCPEGEESALVSLLLASHEDAIKRLFHAPSAQGGGSPLLVSLVFFLFSFGLGLLTYGLAVPSGLFVPAIMSGAALGRLLGELLANHAPGYSANQHPGNFALVGAAAMLGGICRMTISITVIVLESTTSMNYLLPIALTIFIAKLVGDLFNEGIYDLHIELKGYPYMHESVAERRARLQARHIMSTDVKSVHEVEQVGTLLKLLQNSSHHGFPVVACGGGSPGVVLGVVLREQLLTILARRKFERRLPSASPGRRSPSWMRLEGHAGPAGASPPLTADDFLRPWEQIQVEKLELSEAECALSVNLRPYVNEAALVTMENAPLRRIQTLFRSMGLRHLLVAQSCPRVVGVITRGDILSAGEQHLLSGGEAAPLPEVPLRSALRLRWRGLLRGQRRSRALLEARQRGAAAPAGSSESAAYTSNGL